MGQKVSPIGLRLGINKAWESKWYSGNKDFARFLNNDMKIRNYLTKKLKDAAVSSIVIERNSKQTDVIINTTPIGMHPDIDNSPVSIDNNFSEKHIVYDLIYNPPETKLLKFAKKCGSKTLNGLGMLLYQAISAYELITGINIPDNVSSAVITLFENYLSN